MVRDEICVLDAMFDEMKRKQIKKKKEEWNGAWKIWNWATGKDSYEICSLAIALKF